MEQNTLWINDFGTITINLLNESTMTKFSAYNLGNLEVVFIAALQRVHEVFLGTTPTQKVRSARMSPTSVSDLLGENILYFG